MADSTHNSASITNTADLQDKPVRDILEQVALQMNYQTQLLLIIANEVCNSNLGIEDLEEERG